MRLYFSAVLAIAFLVLTVPIQAHHSITALWRTDRTVSITGVVASLKLVNPHPELIVEVREPGGDISRWYVTATGNLKDFIQFGWTSDTLPMGTAITVEGFPSRREGLRALAGVKITTDAGSVLRFGLAVEPTQ